MKRNMGRTVLAVLVIASSVLVPKICFCQSVEELIAAGDALYLKRSASDDYVYQAIKKWEAAFSSDPSNTEPAYKISMAYYFLGRFAPADKREALFVKGKDWGTKAIEADSKAAGGHYWYAVNLAKSYEDKGRLAKLSIVGDIEQNLGAAAALDPKFWYGGPDRVIGMVYFKSPLARNSTAIEHLKKSLEYAPNYSLTLVNLGEVLIKEKRYDEARQYLEKVLTLKPEPGFERELADDQALARELLAKIPK